MMPVAAACRAPQPTTWPCSRLGSKKHKQYPRAAQLRRQEGTVLLSFVMDRNGRVLEYRIERASGHALLDREVEAMIERAQPLPKIPDDLREARLELVVPVQFFLR
jgi:periplasmic protein TonB